MDPLSVWVGAAFGFLSGVLIGLMIRGGDRSAGYLAGYAAGARWAANRRRTEGDDAP